MKYNEIIFFIKGIYKKDIIPLHEPLFIGNEKKYLCNCIDSTFVSSVGEYVNKFERKISKYTGAKFTIATVNGTSALHVALLLADVKNDDEIITQPLTFVATCNAISYCGAKPIFIDVDKDTLGMSPEKLNTFLKNSTKWDSSTKQQINNSTNRPISACVPMHTFGHPCRIDEIIEVCNKYNIEVIEDAAEALGSTYKNKHCGTFGKFGVLSFNGNKTITCGGGGAILTDNEEHAKQARHLTTTAKLAHSFEYIHDEVGFNYRMPNINAALACAQMEQLDKILSLKRNLAEKYDEFFINTSIKYLKEPNNAHSNYWLNAIILKNKTERDLFLESSNREGVMTRPVWQLMNKLRMYKKCQCSNIDNAEWLVNRIVNIPSGLHGLLF